MPFLSGSPVLGVVCLVRILLRGVGAVEGLLHSSSIKSSGLNRPFSCYLENTNRFHCSCGGRDSCSSSLHLWGAMRFPSSSTELRHGWRASAGHVRAGTCPLEHQLTERRTTTFVKGRIHVSFRGPSSQQQRTCTMDDGSSRAFPSIKRCSWLIKSVAALRSFHSCLFLIAGGPNAV